MTRSGREEGCSAEHPGQGQVGSAEQAGGDGSTPAGPGASRPRRRRRHRRVVAPPTNPSADDSDDTVAPADAGPGAPGESARDAWIRAQRPPHWD